MTMTDLYIILTIVFFTLVMVTFSVIPIAIGAALISVLLIGELALSMKTGSSSEEKNHSPKFTKKSRHIGFT